MEEINSIISIFEKLESKECVLDEEMQSWVVKISSKDFGLISTIMSLLKINYKEEKLTKDCILLIYKLINFNNKNENNLNSDIVNQIYKNEDFFTFSKNYINYNSNIKSSIAQEILFITFSIIFLDDKFIVPIDYLKDIEYYKSLLYQVKNITNEAIMNLLVKFFIKTNFFQICINSKFVELELSDSKFLEEKYSDHSFCNDAFNMISYKLQNNEKLDMVMNNILVLEDEKTDIILECSLRLLVNNNIHKEDSLYTIFLFFCLIDHNNKNLFRASDSETLLDYIYIRLANTSTDLVRSLLLIILLKITALPDYKKNNYKKSQIIELLENYIDSDEIMEILKSLSESIINNLES